MVKVKYTGSPQISKRIIPLRDLGTENDDVLVFAADNDFTVEVTEEQAEKLVQIAGGFSVVSDEPDEKVEEDAPEVDAQIDDQASDPEVPSSGGKSPKKKGTPKEV